jgi:hypothetical protein
MISRCKQARPVAVERERQAQVDGRERVDDGDTAPLRFLGTYVSTPLLVSAAVGPLTSGWRSRQSCRVAL